MKTNLIKIGNSRGVRIPKSIIIECEINDALEIVVKDKKIILEKSKSAREGWDKAFTDMAKNKDDKLIFDYKGNKWDKEEWEWK
jgi:antitoxin MazE